MSEDQPPESDSNSSETPVPVQTDVKSNTGLFHQFNVRLLGKTRLIDVYIKLIGALIAVITIGVLIFQLRGITKQNAAVSEQNTAIARQTELMASQNEVMWLSNRPTLKILINDPYEVEGQIRLTISNVGVSTAILHNGYIERLTELAITADTLNYSDMEVPTTDGFDQNLEFSGSRKSVRFFQITLNYSWNHGLDIESDYTLIRPYIVMWDTAQKWAVNVVPRYVYDTNRTVLLERLGDKGP